MGGTVHLVKRFFGSVVPVGPSDADAAWAEDHLLPGERKLWRRMSPVDRRHAAGVARRARHTLGSDATRPVVAAALLHDVGKLSSDLGTYRRVVATLTIKAAGRARVSEWVDRGGYAGRVGLYAEHPRLGAELTTHAGSDPLTVAWTREHHLPAGQWTVPPVIAGALHAADDD